jgi:hypothetical protein
VAVSATASDDARREYVLAEFRCAAIKARLAEFEIQSVGLALKYRLISPEQAVTLFWDSEAIRFLGLELPGER